MDLSASSDRVIDSARFLDYMNSLPIGDSYSLTYEWESEEEYLSFSYSEPSFSPRSLKERSVVNIDYQDLRVNVLGSDHEAADLTALTKSPSWTDEVKKRANIKDNGLILTILKTGFWGFVGTFATLFGQSWTGEVRAAQKMIKNPSTKVVMAVKLFSELRVDFRTLMELSPEELNKLLEDRSIGSIDARSFSEQVEFEGELSLQKIQAKRQKDLVKWINALKLFVNNEEIGFTAKQAIIAKAIDNLVTKGSDKKKPLSYGEDYLINQTLSLAVGDGLIGNEDFSGLEIVDSKIKVDGDAQRVSGKGEIKVRNENDIFEKHRFPSAFITAYAARIAAELQLKLPKVSDSKEELEEGLKSFEKSLADLENEISSKARAFAMAHYTGSDAGDKDKIDKAAKVIERAIWDALFENEDFSHKLSEAVEGDEGLLAQINDLRDFESVQKKAGDAFLQTFSSLSTSYDENHNRSHAETFLNLSKQFTGTESTHPRSLQKQDEMGITWRGLDNHILDLFEKVEQINQLRENQEEKIVTTEELQQLGFSVRDDDPILQKIKVEDGKYDLQKLPDFATQGMDKNDLQFLGFDVKYYAGILEYIHRDGKVYLQDLAAFFYEGTGHEEGQMEEADYAFRTAQTLTRIRRTFRDAVLVLRKDTERPARMVASYDHKKCEARAQTLGNYMTEIQQLKDKAHNTAIVNIDEGDTEQQQKKDQTRNKTLNAFDARPNTAPDPRAIVKRNNLKSETYAKAFIALLSGKKASPTLADEMIWGVGPTELAQHLSSYSKQSAENIEFLLRNLTSRKLDSRNHQLVVQLDESKGIYTYQRQFNPKQLEGLKAILTPEEVANEVQEEVREVSIEKLEEAVNNV